MRNIIIGMWARRGRTWLASALLAAVTVALAPASAAAQEVEYYATDAVGSVRVVFDAAGNVKAQSDYLPFGEALNATGNLPAQRFTGQERDGEAGLDNFNARDYAVRAGRLASVDPASGIVTAPQSWNRYAYVRNNPLGRVDPSGAYDGPVATPTTNCRQEAGAYWCPGSLFIPSPFDPSSVDPLFNPDRQGYRGGEELGMAEMQYGATVDQIFMSGAVAASQAQGPTASVTTKEELDEAATAKAILKFVIDAVCTFTLCVESATGQLYTPDISAQLGAVIDPARVRFSQSDISRNFKTGGSIEDLAAGLRSGSVNPADVPPIRLFERGGNLFTLDNRRLWSFKQAGVSIPYRMATPQEAAQAWRKFSTKNGGVSIRVR